MHFQHKNKIQDESSFRRRMALLTLTGVVIVCCTDQYICEHQLTLMVPIKSKPTGPPTLETTD